MSDSVEDIQRWRRLQRLVAAKHREALGRGMVDTRDIAEWICAELADELRSPGGQRLMVENIIAPAIEDDIEAVGLPTAWARFKAMLTRQAAARATNRKRH